ncbi:MAG: SDR family NAD(P)-dependent oxidoreductase [Verrucomicrobiota bacterium]
MSGLLKEKYKTAFVTGASSGLGEAFTRMLLKEGIRVWGTSRDVNKLGKLKNEFGDLFTLVSLDLADAESALSVFKEVEINAGNFDLVIQNAGFGVFGAFEGLPSTEWKKQLDQMLLTTVLLSHAAWSSMRKKDSGILVHVSSLATEFPLPFMSGYNIAKAGLSALSESLIFEARGSGLCMIDFRPGDYRTAFNGGMQAAALALEMRDPRLIRAWEALEKNLNEAPSALEAALDLKRALERGNSGVIRSGGFFQARLAPLAARLLPKWLMRSLSASYFK